MLTTSNLMLIVLTIATLLMVVCYPILTFEPFRYSVVIEGRSTLSRIYVYRYKVQYGRPVSEFEVVDYKDDTLRPGLSVYADDPAEASVSLTKLVVMAKLRIPKRMWKKTEVRLIATSTGTSLLKKSVGEKFLQVTVRVLKSSGFMFRDEWAYIYPKPVSEDTVNAWVLTYFALGSLGGDPLHIKHVVEGIQSLRGTKSVFSQGQADYAGAVPKHSETYQGLYVLLFAIMILFFFVFACQKM